VVGAAGAGKLHAAFDASDGVVSLHNFKCRSLRGKLICTGVGRRR
jgi:hypothetical protein